MKLFSQIKVVITILTVIIYYSNSAAQSGAFYCGADELRMQTISNPQVRNAVAQREAQLEQYTQNFVQRSAPSYIIPVVFHVIHNYGAENISDAQIYDAIRVVNNNYRKTNADTSVIIPAFQNMAVDCGIELRLAQIDPNGNCTKGINRIASTTTYTGGHEVKQLIHWDPTKYLNVYVVANAAGLAGHSVWPSDADTIPAWDGIVISHNYVGSIGTSNVTQSVVLSHELGHYLNLHHIWGGNNVPGFYYLPCGDPGNCAYDDYVSDTPNTIGWSTCNLNGSSCGNTVDNVQNFMDYAYCAHMFTDGQKQRMQACLNSSIAGRNNLWTPANLTATGTDVPAILCAADFTASDTIICAGSTVTLTDLSYHNPSSRQWQFFSTEVPSSLTDSVITVTYPDPGIYRVKLTAGDGTNFVSADKIDYIVVQQSPGMTLPYAQDFELTADLFSNEIHFGNPQSDGTFVLEHSTGHSGNNCVKFENYNTESGYTDELLFGPFNANPLSTVQLSFYYAFCQRDSVTATDHLQVMVSADCGDTWAIRKTLGVSLLTTAAASDAPFIPQSSDWTRVDVTNISASYTTGEFMFKLVYRSGNGNLFYLDDINIAANVGVGELQENDLLVYQREGSLIVQPGKPQLYTGYVYDVTGRVIISFKIPAGSGQYDLSTQGWSPGIYTVTLQGADHKLVRKTLVH